MMAGGGAALSATLSGFIADSFGSQIAFLGLGAIALAALAAVWVLIPETKPQDE
jgi:predicted MFS family arabinose efflux permease